MLQCVFLTLVFFPKKDLTESINGRPVLFCKCKIACTAKNILRPPVKIPVDTSPASSVRLSLELRNCSSQLKNNNNWTITDLWEFFAKKKSLLKKLRKTRLSMSRAQKTKLVRKMCLRGRYGSAKKAIFSSQLTKPFDKTIRKLKNLHPVEDFCCPKPKICKFWTDALINLSEVQTAINHLPKGKAAGPYSISFDILKSDCRKAPKICDDLAEYFQNLVCLNTIFPTELLAARLIALVKPGNGKKPDGFRPIAVGESITRLLASIVFNRVASKAAKLLAPLQFGIKTIDGASVAALTSDLFLNSYNQNFIFN
ncbi:hypothetical protein P9112_007228 [Eukaryota sp. TZLM1-RC]